MYSRKILKQEAKKILEVIIFHSHLPVGIFVSSQMGPYKISHRQKTTIPNYSMHLL